MSVSRRDFLIGTAGVAAAVAPSTGRVLPAAQAASLRLQFRGFGVLAVDRAENTPDAAPQSRRAHLLLTQNLDKPRHYQTLTIHQRFVMSPHPRPHVSGFIEWNIRDHFMEIVGTIGGDGVSVAQGRPRDSVCPTQPTAEAWEDVSWLGNLERASGQGYVNTDCLSNDPPGSVAARVDLGKGRVKASRPGDADYANTKWRFDPVIGPPMEQVLADGVDVTVSVGSDVALRLTRFSPPATTRPEQVTIRLKLPQGSPSIDVMVLNEPSPDVLPEDPNHVYHFAAYYELLGRVPSRRPVPVKGDTCQAIQAKRRLGSFCPVGLAFLVPGS